MKQNLPFSVYAGNSFHVWGQIQGALSGSERYFSYDRHIDLLNNV